MENENFQQLKSSRWGQPGSAFVSLRLPCSLACAQHPRPPGGVAPTPGRGVGWAVALSIKACFLERQDWSHIV